MGDFKIEGKASETTKHTEDLVVLMKEVEIVQDMTEQLEETQQGCRIEISVDKSKVMRMAQRKEPLQIVVRKQEL